MGCGNFAQCVVSLWQIHGRIDKATEEPLGKELFWVGGRSFFLKGSLTDLHHPFLSCVLFSDLRAELTIACRADSQQHEPRFPHLFPSLLFRVPGPIKTSSLQISSYPILSSQASTPSLGQNASSVLKGKCCCFPLRRASWRGSSSLKVKLPCLCCWVPGLRRHLGNSGRKGDLKFVRILMDTVLNASSIVRCQLVWTLALFCRNTVF